MKPVRLGVIGPGLIFRDAIAPVLADMSDAFRVKALCARTQATLDLNRARYPEARAYLDVDALLRDEEIDAVLVATPIELNGPMCIRALEAGKDVFAEKPLAATLTDAQRIVALMRETGRHVFMIEHFVYKQSVMIAKKLLNEGVIGRLLYADIEFHYIIDSDVDPMGGYAMTPWRIEANFPLGAILDGGVHYLAIINHLFGKPDKLFAMGTRIRDRYGDYDHILTTMDFAGMLKVTFSHSGVLQGHEHFSIWGSEGMMAVDDGLVVVSPNTGPQRRIELDGADGNRAMWAHFARCIETGEPPMFTALDALEGLRIIDAINRSLDGGTCVTM